MSRLSGNEFNLALILRDLLGSEVKGVGPDVRQLVDLWEGDDPEDLRPAIDGLERIGFINVDRRIATSHPDIDSSFNVNDIAGISVTEALQDYMDKEGI